MPNSCSDQRATAKPDPTRKFGVRLPDRQHSQLMRSLGKFTWLAAAQPICRSRTTAGELIAVLGE